MNNQNNKNEQGVTLIEIIIVSVILVLLASGILGLQYILSQNREVSVRSYLSVNQANTNLTLIEREIRTARLSESGAYPIVTANDNELIFYSDADFDGVVERIRYTLTDSTLSRGIVDPTGQPYTYILANESVKTLTDNVRNGTIPMFEYYNGDWPTDTINNPLTTPAILANIKLIRINVRVNTLDSDPTTDYVLNSFTAVRMLKENL